MARLVEGIGWLLIVGGLLWLMAVLAAEFNLTVLLHPLQLNYAAVVQIAGALLCGAVTVLWGQAARALFDQASATRELVAIERTRDGAEHF